MSDQSSYQPQKYCEENQTLGYWFDITPYFSNYCFESDEIIKVKDYNNLITCIKEADYYLDAKNPHTHNGKSDQVDTPVDAIINDQTNLNNNVEQYTIISYYEHFKNIKENLHSSHQIDQNEIIYGSYVDNFKNLLNDYQLSPSLTHKVWTAATCCDPGSGGSGGGGGTCNCEYYGPGGYGASTNNCTGSGYW